MNSPKVQPQKSSISANAYLPSALWGAYFHTLNCLVSRGQLHGNNCHSSFALGAFITAVAAWEAFINASFLCPPFTKEWFGEKTNERLVKLNSSLEKLNIIQKTSAIPLILFDRTFDSGGANMQDFSTLVGIRNALVHNFVQHSPRTHLVRLEHANVYLRLLPEPLDQTQPWIVDISTLEAIRWCINLLARLEKELRTFPTVPTTKWTKVFHPLSAEMDKAYIDYRFEHGKVEFFALVKNQKRQKRQSQ